jgi:hypothetical protein
VSSKINKATFKIRRDASSTWTSLNPIPKQGEWCLETDTGYTKLGDGTTAWVDLQYNVGPSWDDIRSPAVQGKVGLTSPPSFEQILDDGGGSTGVFSYVFSATQEKELFFAVQMPHSWKVGSNVLPHLHWLPSSNGTGSQKVSWGIEYSAGAISDVFPNTTITYANTAVLDETLVANKQYATVFEEIDLSAQTIISSMIMFRVFRDATGTGLTDDFTGTAALLEVDFHFQMDTLGSYLQFEKS